MAKIPFNKLGLKEKSEIATLEYNDLTIEVKQYLPIEEKLELMLEVINKSQDDNNFYNESKGDIFYALGLIEHYTNISFSKKQLEDPCKLYDLIVETGFGHLVIELIPMKEIVFIEEGIKKIAAGYYNYKNSALGILESINQDYSNLKFDATELQGAIADPNNLELLRSILTKLG